MNRFHMLANGQAIVSLIALVWTLSPMSAGESDKALRIMPMGDSITEGTVPGGYRHPLHRLLVQDGYKVEFVGAKTQDGDSCPDPNHWGKGGWQISQTPVTIEERAYFSIQGENRSGLYEEIPRAITQAYFSGNTSDTRNIILLQIGINDILHQVVDSSHGSFNTDAGMDGKGEGQEWVAEGCIARLQALLRLINSTAASNKLRIEVMLGTLYPPTAEWDGDAVSDVLIKEVGEYNKHITTAVPTMDFSNITVRTVDMYGAIKGKLSDGLHPDAGGYAAMAMAWFNAITTTHADVVYGPDGIRNSLDFWQARGSGPRPLLVHIHGGGWDSGDKNSYFNYKTFLDRGISCASITYRFTPGHPLPVPVHDAARAIQFLRTKADEWNIDADKIALYGGSAGACSAMWLLLHDDLADPGSADPVARQSTRVCAVWAYSGQTSIDPPVIREWIGPMVLRHRMIHHAVGQPTMEAVWPSPGYEGGHRAVFEEFSPINHLDAGDPPLYMEYSRRMVLPASSDGDAIHHPQFGVKMLEKSKASAGHECHLRFPSSRDATRYRNTTGTSYESGEEFLLAKLLGSDDGHTVTYHANGATSGSVPEAQVKVRGVALVIKGNSGGLARAGCVFAGWNTSADGTGTGYPAGATYAGNQDLKLHAVWKPE